MRESRWFDGWIVVGAAAVIVALGLGALFSLAVFIKPMLGSYAWLFLSSAAIGVAAMLLALTFRPPSPVVAVATTSG